MDVAAAQQNLARRHTNDAPLRENSPQCAPRNSA